MPISLSNTANPVGTADTTTYTFSAQSIGAAVSDRVVAVVIVGRGASGTLTSVTIGGVSATVNIAATEVDGGGSSNTVAVASAAVPTGTTADVVVTWAATHWRCAVGVYALTGGGTISAVGTDSDTAGDDDTATISLAPAAGDVVLCGSMTYIGAGATATWSGGVTEDYDSEVESAAMSWASAEVASGGGISPQVVWSGTTANVLAGCVYRGEAAASGGCGFTGFRGV